MKTKKMLATAAVSATVLTLGAIPVLANVDPVRTTDSDASIIFIPDPSPVDPIDPIDPTRPIDPEDGGEGTTGPLSINFASSFFFGEQLITTQDMTYNARAQRATQDGETVYVPNFVQVTDNRGTLEGWTLRVTQQDQFRTADGHELVGASISLSGATPATASDSSVSFVHGTKELVPGEASDVMAAAVGEGSGTHITRWGSGSYTAADNLTEFVELFVPGTSTQLAAEYSTVLRWGIYEVPANQ